MWSGADSGELVTALIPAVWAFLGIVVATLGTIAVQWMQGRKGEKTLPSPPPPAGNGNGSASLLQVARDVARDIGQLDQRANDNDERDDVQDRELRDQRHALDEHHDRLKALERFYDRHDPGWRD